MSDDLSALARLQPRVGGVWSGTASSSFTALFFSLTAVDPCARVFPKRINLCYSFVSAATQIRDLEAKKQYSSLLQISN